MALSVYVPSAYSVEPGWMDYLSEESRPYRLYVVEIGGLDKCLELVGLYCMLSLVLRIVRPAVQPVVNRETYGDVNLIIGQDESCVRSGELRVRHYGVCPWL